MTTSHHLGSHEHRRRHEPGRHSRNLLLLLVFLTVSTNVAGGWQAPLSDDEITQSANIVISERSADQSASARSADSTGTHRFSRSIPPGEETATSHPLGTQILLVELKELKNPSPDQPQRSVDVFVFDYHQGVTELYVVDVEQGEIITTRKVNSVHLPLASAEIDYAHEVLLNNASVQRRIAEELDTHGFLPLLESGEADLSLLQFKVSIWVPTSQQQVGESACHQERCALVSLFAGDHFNLSVEPVINLMSGELYTHLIQ